jgi:hypothetical protein
VEERRWRRRCDEVRGGDMIGVEEERGGTGGKGYAHLYSRNDYQINTRTDCIIDLGPYIPCLILAFYC